MVFSRVFRMMQLPLCLVWFATKQATRIHHPHQSLKLEYIATLVYIIPKFSLMAIRTRLTSISSRNTYTIHPNLKISNSAPSGNQISLLYSRARCFGKNNFVPREKKKELAQLGVEPRSPTLCLKISRSLHSGGLTIRPLCLCIIPTQWDFI